MLPAVLTTIVYIGCYTDATHPDGIYAVALDTGSGEMRIEASYQVPSAIYLAKSADGQRLYSCARRNASVFGVDGSKLKPLKSVECGIKSLCHISLSGDGKSLYFADYSGSSCGSAELDAGGIFTGKVIRRVHDDRPGPDRSRQDMSHCHQAEPAPDGKVAVCDLGTDRIVMYRGDGFERTGAAAMPPGAGPRHLIFHPGGKLAFVLFELGNLVGSYRYENGEFTQLDVQNLLAAGAPAHSLAAAIRFSPDGKTLLCSNRGEHSIVAFSFDEETGKLKLKGRTFLPGDWPRDFNFITPTLALATMERSGEVHSLRYDPESGTFKLLFTLKGLYRPVCAVR